MGFYEKFSELEAFYKLRRDEIRQRLEEFRGVCGKGDRAIFEELCYCVLTAKAVHEIKRFSDTGW